MAVSGCRSSGCVIPFCFVQFAEVGIAYVRCPPPTAGVMMRRVERHRVERHRGGGGVAVAEPARVGPSPVAVGPDSKRRCSSSSRPSRTTIAPGATKIASSTPPTALPHGRYVRLVGRRCPRPRLPRPPRRSLITHSGSSSPVRGERFLEEPGPSASRRGCRRRIVCPGEGDGRAPSSAAVEQCGKDRAVGPVHAWPRVGAAGHGERMAKHQQLDVLG